MKYDSLNRKIVAFRWVTKCINGQHISSWVYFGTAGTMYTSKGIEPFKNKKAFKEYLKYKHPYEQFKVVYEGKGK